MVPPWLGQCHLHLVLRYNELIFKRCLWAPHCRRVGEVQRLQFLFRPPLPCDLLLEGPDGVIAIEIDLVLSIIETINVDTNRTTCLLLTPR